MLKLNNNLNEKYGEYKYTNDEFNIKKLLTQQ